jgi:hypothetical protein
MNKFFFVWIFTFISCNVLKNNCNSSISERFCEKITEKDILNFRHFDYNERLAWSNRNTADSSITQWYYNPTDDYVYINYGFNAFNKSFNLPYVLADSTSVFIKQIYNDSSRLFIQIGNNKYESDNQFDTLSIDSIKINPLDCLKRIDLKRRELGILDIQNSRFNNMIQFYISTHDVLYYIPDSIVNKYIIPIDSARIDTMSQHLIKYVKNDFIVIRDNWYYKKDKKGLDY